MDQGAKSARPLPSAELNLGGTSTSEKQFLTASADGQTASGQPLACYLPGSNTLKNRPFKIRCGGRVTTGATANFTGIIYYGTSSTIASNTAFMSTGAVSLATLSGTWGLECDVAWDNTSQRIDGLGKGWVRANAVAQITLTGAATGVALAGEGSLGFTVTGTFSSGNASNVAYVDWFEVIPL